MVKKIVRDQFFLQQKSEPATEADRQVVEDLLDTLRANQAGCRRSFGYIESKSGQVRGHGREHDRSEKADHCCGYGTIYFSYDKSGYYKEDRRVSDGGELSFSGRRKALHQI